MLGLHHSQIFEKRFGTRSSAILRKLEQLAASVAVPHGYDTNTDTRVLYCSFEEGLCECVSLQGKIKQER